MRALSKWPFPSRLETRTKESNILASVWVFKTSAHNESKSVALRYCTVGTLTYVYMGAPSPGPDPFGVVGFVAERVCWDPKDGELFLNRAKPEETLVEARSDADVQIARRIWV